VTGLGTPVANLLVSDLVAYHGADTTYPGPTVGALQDATLTNTGSSSGGPTNVFSVFDSFTVTGNGHGHSQVAGLSSNLGSSRFGLPTRGVVDRTVLTQGLNIRAAGFRRSTPFVINPVVLGPGSAAAVAVGMAPLDNITASDTTPTGSSPSRTVAAKRVPAKGITIPASSTSTASLQGSAALRSSVLQASLVDALLSDHALTQSLGKVVRKNGSAKKVTDPASDTLNA
jgi:hypothetical protein